MASGRAAEAAVYTVVVGASDLRASDSNIQHNLAIVGKGRKPNADALKIAARRVGALRRQQELSQRQLARDCGVSSGHLSLIERGMVLPTVGTLEAIAARLDVEVVDLLIAPEDSLRHRIIATTLHLDRDQLKAVDRYLDTFDPRNDDEPSGRPSRKAARTTRKRRRSKRRRKPADS